MRKTKRAKKNPWVFQLPGAFFLVIGLAGIATAPGLVSADAATGLGFSLMGALMIGPVWRAVAGPMPERARAPARVALVSAALVTAIIALPTPQEDAPNTSRPPTPRAPQTAPRFAPASASVIDKINAFLESGQRITSTAYTAPAQDSAGGHFVAAEIANSSGYVGVWWLAGTLELPTLTMAVDHIADEICVCPWVRNTRSSISMDDAPAADLKRYVESLTRDR